MAQIVSTGQITITDQNDYIFQGTTAPVNPIANLTLWIDTSFSPSQQKRWTGSTWEIVNEVVVGGRNLLTDTKLMSSTVWNYSAGASFHETINGFSAYKIKNQWGRIWRNNLTYKANTTYTLSFYVRRDDTVETLQTYMNIYKSGSLLNILSAKLNGINLGGGSVNGTIGINGIIGIQLDILYKKLEVTFIASEDVVCSYLRIEFYTADYANNTPCGVLYGYNLEIGNKATDWTPAPEDVQTAIDAAATAAANAQTSANTANSAVSTLNGYVDGAFKDGVVDTAEASAIDKLQKQVNLEYDNAINDYNVVYANAYLTGTAKTNLLNSKITLAGAKDALITSITTAIADGKTTPAEKADVDSKFATYKSAFADYQTKLSNAAVAIQATLKSYSDAAQTTANSADTKVNALRKMVTIDASALDPDTYYPVVTSVSPKLQTEINVVVALDSGTKPAWSLHASGFSCNFREYVNGSGWGVSTVMRTVLTNTYSYASVNPIGDVFQLINTSAECIYVRGGGIYFFYVTNNVNPVLYSTTYTGAGGQSASPKALADVDFTTNKTTIQSSIATVTTSAATANSSVAALKNFTDTSFADGIVSRGEAAAIYTYKNVINAQFNDFEKSYLQIYSSPFLEGTPKSDLLSAKNALTTAKDNLLAGITSAIADGITTTAEKANVDSLFTTYNNSVASFKTALEAANVAITNKLKTYSDAASTAAAAAAAAAAQAQADATISKAKTQYTTVIEGGTVYAALMMLGLGGIAGVNGIATDSNGNALPAFWAGGSYADAIARAANFIAWHNGDVKAGCFEVDATGNIMIKDGSEVKVFMTNNQVNTLAQLGSSSSQGTVSNAYTEAFTLGISSIDLPNSLVIANNNTAVTIATKIRAIIIANAGTDYTSIELVLRKSTGAEISLGVAMADSINMQKIVTINRYMVLQAGTYTLRLYYDNHGSSSTDFFSAVEASTMDYSYTPSLQQTAIGKNGLYSFFDINNFMYMAAENGVFKAVIKGADTDLPGVLATGNMSSTGQISGLWGAKSLGMSGYKALTGVYVINHNIGHANYRVLFTASDDYFVFITSPSKTNTQFSIYVSNRNGVRQDVEFDFVVVGKN